ncbi:MAG TPA: hypothetical protein VF187_05340 [Gemmatimonadales bacterium]
MISLRSGSLRGPPLRGRYAMLALIVAAACGPAPAKVPPAEILALASDTLTAPWANIPSATWLGGRRWALVANDWDEAAVADFNARNVTPLGGAIRKGYQHPASVFAVGDTVYLADWGLRRTTVWAGDRLIDSIPFPDALRGTAPRSRDAAGQFYFEVRPAPGRDGSGNRDSAAIVRSPVDLSRFDTVARLAPVDVREMNRENSSRFERQVFSGDDLWGVWRDGTVWIARLLRNNIWSISPTGQTVRGPELPDPVFEVTQADRDRYLQGFPADVRPKETDLPFALIWPPFVAAFSGPGDQIWLEKSKPVLDSLRTIHVLDRQGNLLRVFQLSGPGRLIAIGSEALLVAEQFEKGVRLMEVRIPAPPAYASPSPGGGS